MRPDWRRDIQKRVDLGITRAIWIYSYARNSSCEHKQLDGKSFDIRKGMKFQFKRVYPGAEKGCNCLSRSIIKGFRHSEEPTGFIQRLIGFFRR